MKTVWIPFGLDADAATLEGFGIKNGTADHNPEAIKIGLPKVPSDLLSLMSFIKNYSGFVVVDGNANLINYCNDIFCFIDVLILDIHEMELHALDDIEEAAQEFLKLGVKNVLLKGRQSSWSHDYWANDKTSFWLTQCDAHEFIYPEIHSVFSTAIAAALALGYTPQDSIIIASMYTRRGIRLGQSQLYHGGFPEDETDLPYLASTPLTEKPQPFKPCSRLGLYPVVDNARWVEILLNSGVKTIQLRIKERRTSLEDEIKQSIALAKKYQATLFINDYWDLALKLDAEAVHLGQSDLDTADLEAIRRKGLMLGISTHCYYEVARAHALSPSYIAIGPVYPTTSKDMPFVAQGIEQLSRWQRTLNYPLVAIGGINLQCMPDVIATGVDGVALISAIMEARDPRMMTQEMLSLIS